MQTQNTNICLHGINIHYFLLTRTIFKNCSSFCPHLLLLLIYSSLYHKHLSESENFFTIRKGHLFPFLNVEDFRVQVLHDSYLQDYDLNCNKLYICWAT